MPVPVKQPIIPLAYFITFSCYGTWLHGKKTTSVDRRNNTYETDFLSVNPARQASVEERMLETPYLLNDARRNIVLSAIKEVCNHRLWSLLAAHVRTNHIHFAVRADIKPEIIISTIKAYASRRLNEAKLDDKRVNRWTKHGSTRYLWRSEEVVSVIQYIVHEQGSPMAVFQDERYAQVPGDIF